MEAQITRWGNGQGIRIPKSLMKEMGVGLNEKLNLLVSDGKLVIEKQFHHKTLEERAQKYGGTLGPYTEFDWGEPEGREIL